MLGHRLTYAIRPTTPRPMTRLHLFLSFLKTKQIEATKRSEYLTPNGNGTRLLTAILKTADLEAMIRTDKYTDYIVNILYPMVKDLEKHIDVRRGNYTANKLFIKTKNACFEMITPVRTEYPLENIPFDVPYDDPRWNTIRPFRIVELGACDLTFSLHTDYLQYRKHGPTHAVYTLDCFALVTKFIAYYKSRVTVPNFDQCILDFLHDDIIIPTLQEDSLALWLRNIYRSQFILNSPLESRTSTVWDAIVTDTLGSDFTGAMMDVHRIKKEIENNAISLRTLVSSLPLTTTNKSFSVYYTQLCDTTRIPRQQPYIWVECLKHLTWIETILLFTSFIPDHPESLTLRRQVRRDLELWVMMKPWQMISGSIPFRTMIRNRLEGLVTYLDI